MTRTRKAAFSLLAILLLLLLSEGVLTLAGFRYQRVTTDIRFHYPRPGYLRAFFELDPELLYRIRKTVKQRWVDLTWQEHFQLKIRDHRVFGAKPDGVLRVLALGDSSTYGVNTELPWPTRLQRLLDSASPGRFQVLNLGVPGYTAFQGRKLLETRGDRLQPDLVVAYFGWNDHLLAMRTPDAEQQVGSEPVVAARNLLSRSRAYQALSWGIARLRQWGADEQPPDTPSLRRVGPQAFESELTTIHRLAAELGGRTIFCTYPTAVPLLGKHDLPVPDFVVNTHLGEGALPELLALQQAYNDTVRRVAAATGGLLIDLEQVFQAAGRDRLFHEAGTDLMHPNDRGYDLIARQLASGLRRPTP